MQSYSMKCLCKAISSCNVKINTLTPGGHPGEDPAEPVSFDLFFREASREVRFHQEFGGSWRLLASQASLVWKILGKCIYWVRGWRTEGRVCFVIKKIGQDFPVPPRVTNLCGLRTSYLDNPLWLSFCWYSRNRS